MEHIGLEINIPNEERGFSLIEILIALVILSIALLALAGLMATTTRNNAAGGHLTEAATFAQDTLERLRLSPLDSIPVSTMIQDNMTGSTNIIYTSNWIAIPDSSNTLDKITITVTWNDPASHSISMVSVVPRQ